LVALLVDGIRVAEHTLCGRAGHHPGRHQGPARPGRGRKRARPGCG
jgi:hypothetical protein